MLLVLRGSYCSIIQKSLWSCESREIDKSIIQKSPHTRKRPQRGFLLRKRWGTWASPQRTPWGWLRSCLCSWISQKLWSSKITMRVASESCSMTSNQIFEWLQPRASVPFFCLFLLHNLERLRWSIVSVLFSFLTAIFILRGDLPATRHLFEDNLPVMSKKS